MSMKQAKTHCLVIDASIAHAAGGLDSVAPTGLRCSNFLIAVRGICHRMAWSESIKNEWDRHQSLFAGQWLVSMMNMGKLRPVKEELSETLRKAIAEHSSDKYIAEIMLKDAHLIEAALATDSRIAALDETARGHFGRLAALYEKLRQIIWVNPAIEEEQVIEWLRSGASPKPHRKLGYRRKRKR